MRQSAAYLEAASRCCSLSLTTQELPTESQRDGWIAGVAGALGRHIRSGNGAIGGRDNEAPPGTDTAAPEECEGWGRKLDQRTPVVRMQAK